MSKQRGNCQGFTLIEMLVVVVLIGIIGSYVLLNLSKTSQQRQASDSLYQAQHTFDGIADLAILKGLPMGLHLKENQWVVLQPSPSGWLQIDIPNQQTPVLSDNWQFVFETDQQLLPELPNNNSENDEKDMNPDIVFFEDGTSTGGRLYLYHDGIELPVFLQVQANGKMSLEGESSAK